MKRQHILPIFAFLFMAMLGTDAFASTQPDAIYRLIRRTYTVNQDGSMDIQYRKEITLLRNRAITAYADKGETFILYNPDCEQLTINESYTLLPDGTRVMTPANAFVEQLPSECENCGRYNHIREMAVIHTGLEYDCTIVLDYTIHRSSLLVSEQIDMQMDCPVERYEIICDHHGRLRKLATPKEGTLIADAHDFHWVATNIPQASLEPYQVQDTSYSLSMSFLSMPRYETRPSLAAAANIVATLHDEDTLQYIVALRNWVRDNIRTNPVPLAHLNFEPSAAITTFQSGCGTPLDKTVLLCAMIREAGFSAEIENASEGFYDINRVNVLVTIGNMEYRINPNNNNHPRVKDAAHDEVRSILSQRNGYHIRPTLLYGNIYSYTFPKVEQPDIDITRLTANRTQLFTTRPLNYERIQTVELNDNYQLEKPVRIKKSIAGIGSLSIEITQISPNTIQEKRHLIIEKRTFEPYEYKKLRKLLIIWFSNDSIILTK